MTLATGAPLGPYEVLAPLGAGGMGEVFLAEDTDLERRVAVKVLRAEIADAYGEDVHGLYLREDVLRGNAGGEAHPVGPGGPQHDRRHQQPNAIRLSPLVRLMG